MNDSTQDRVDLALRLLSRRSMSTTELLRELDVSQPTLSRTIQALPSSHQFRVTGERTPRYGMLRLLPGSISGLQTVYAVDRGGKITAAGQVALLAGGESSLTLFGRRTLHDGLPPSMSFAAPSGYLGRAIAHDVSSDLRLPDSLRDWGDDQIAAFLFQRGADMPGNLVFGAAALELLVMSRTRPPVPADQRLAHFAGQARHLELHPAGSSAGGEQPKFMAHMADTGHVLVKFARNGTRMADLLRLEHLAQRCLSDASIEAAETALHQDAENTYLEVRRFDRMGPAGRIGMLSAGALDDHLFGQRDSWPAFAARCADQRLISRADARRVDVMAAFSELIGNSDRHFENLSLLLDAAGQVERIAPAYDILPMRYAPLGGGVDPALVPVEPRLGAGGADPEVWREAHAAARSFWLQASEDQGLSAAMRELALANTEAVYRFMERLDPGAVELRESPKG